MPFYISRLSLIILIRNMVLQIFTDGASRGNPGRGGYGIILKWNNTIREYAQGYRLTTNNRMELLAVIVALEKLTRTGIDVEIYTDSKYVVDAVEKKWVWNWNRNNWKDKKNIDLWQRYLKLHDQFNIKFIWVKGHATHQMNNRCDYLATTAADSNNLLIDEAYENEHLGK
jgi:ribonuclease HI